MCRFTIRDVLWATAMLGMGLAWWIERAETGRQVAEDAKTYDACIALLRDFVEDLRYPKHGVHISPTYFDTGLKAVDKAHAKLKNAKR